MYGLLMQHMDLQDIATLVAIVVGVVVIAKTSRSSWSGWSTKQEDHRLLIASIAGPAPDNVKPAFAKWNQVAHRPERFKRL